MSYCPNCGSQVNEGSRFCTSCGRPLGNPVPPVNAANDWQEQRAKDDRWLITLLLCWFLGIFGIHRFYTGNTVTGVLMVITLGGCGFWTLIDFIMIVFNVYHDGNGQLLK